MDIQTITVKDSNRHSLVDDYLSHWIGGSENSRASGLIQDLTKNLVDKLEPGLADEYKSFITKFYQSINSSNHAREEGLKQNPINTLDEIIKAKA